MTKKKIGIIGSAVASCAVCASLIVGSTYALFTSEDKVNISVSSAAVSVIATADNLEAYSGKWNGSAYESVKQENVYSNGAAEGYYFANGGFAAISGENNSVIVNAITPYDSLTFDITVTNQSTVGVKYRTVIGIEADSDTALFNALDFAVGGVELTEYDGKFVSSWGLMTSATETYTVSIALPDVGNEYQDLVVNCYYSVEAVQANAEVNDPTIDENTIALYTAEDLLEIANAVNSGATRYEGKTLALMNDIDMSGIEWVAIGNTVSSYPSKTFAGTFDGKGHTISNLTSAAERATNNDTNAADGLFGTITGKIKNLTLTNVTIKGTHYVGAVVGYSSTNVGMSIDNCHVIGATLVSTPVEINGKYDNGDKVGGIIGYTVVGDKISNCSVENANITGYRHIGGIAGYSQATITNCTVTNTALTQDFTNGYKTVSAVINLIGEIVGEGIFNETCSAENVTYQTVAPVISNATELALVLNAGRSAEIVLSEKLTEDLSSAEQFIIVDDVVLDLNGKTLNLSFAKDTLCVHDGASLTIKNGTLNLSADVKPSTDASISVVNGTLIVENATVASPIAAILAEGNSKVTISDSTVEAGVYCFGTNAGAAENHGVVAVIKNSTLTSTGSTAVLVTVSSNVEIDNCTVTGQIQAVFVRAGNVTVTNSTLSCKGVASYGETDWSSGNQANTGALIIGSKNSNGTYQAPVVTIENCVLEAYGKSDYLFLIWADNENGATVTYKDITVSENSKVNNYYFAYVDASVTINGKALESPLSGDALESPLSGDYWE